MELHERVTRLEERVRNQERKIGELSAQLDGPPWERSVRGRLHMLENESAAAKVAAASLAEAQAERRRAAADLEHAESRAWSWRWKLLGAVTAIAAVAAPYIQMARGL